MNLRSELGRVKGLGAAGGGVHHWRLQRMTAIAQEKNTLEARLSQALPPAEIAQAGRQLKALSDEMSVLEERWMELSEQLQTLQAEA